MSETIDGTLEDLTKKMHNSLTNLQHDLRTIRTGRASPDLLRNLSIESYGAHTPLEQIATITAPEARLLHVQVWDKGNVTKVGKAISDADLGFNPMTEGQIIRINLPPMTEEHRKDLVKLIHKYTEKAKIAIRNVRRQMNDAVKASVTGKDEIHTLEAKIQKITDEQIQQIDLFAKQKESDVLTL